jgi:hypothetical protein
MTIPGPNFPRRDKYPLKQDDLKPGPKWKDLKGLTLLLRIF